MFMGFSRQEYWRGQPFPSPGDLPNPGSEPGSPALQADSLPSEPPGVMGQALVQLQQITTAPYTSSDESFNRSTNSPVPDISCLSHLSSSGGCVIVSHMVFCLFIRAVLLRYNFYTIKTTHCKQFIFSKIQLCRHHHSPILEHFHHPRKFSSAHLQSFLLPHPGNH